jgi:peptidoglycan/LPS O-acetylase OafA/YrhL
MIREEGQPRIADIQVLRAVAITLVLIQHAWFNLVFNVPWYTALITHVPMWCGVDLFFVISGFVIARSLVPSLDGPHAGLALGRFWVRRIFRLWPAAWLWLALPLAGSFLFRDPPFLGTVYLNFHGAVAGLLAFANFRFAHLPHQPYGATYPYWSLSLEEQFYLLLPALVLIARRHLPWVALALALVQLPLPHDRLYFFLRSDGLLWGVFLATAPVAREAGRRAARWLTRIPFAGWIVLALAVAAMSALSPGLEISPPWRLGAMAMCGAVVVLFAGADRNLLHGGPWQPVLLWVGSRSYVLYLCHVPIYQCAAALSRWIGDRDPILGSHLELRSTLIGLVALIAAAEATHRLVELPWRRRGGRLAEQLRSPSHSSAVPAQAQGSQAGR